MSIEPDRDQAIPGETVQYEVQVTDSEGVGVAADVSVAVVDQAVLSLLDESARDGMSAFWYERALGVRTASSLAVSVDRRNEAYDEVVEGERGQGTGGTASLTEDFAEGDMAEEAPAEAFRAVSAISDTGESAGPRIRSNFQNTAEWEQLTTDEEGQGQLRADTARQRHHLARSRPRRHRRAAGGRGRE